MYGTRTYTYDEFQNRVQKTDNDHTVSYAYHAFNQLVEKTTPDHQLTSHYDKRGNVIERKENKITKTRYTFDSANRLAKAESDGNITEYQYDGLDNRIHTKVTESKIVVKDMTYVIDPVSDDGNILMTSNRLTGENTSFGYGKNNELVSLTNPHEVSYYKTDEKTVSQGSLIRSETGQQVFLMRNMES